MRRTLITLLSTALLSSSLVVLVAAADQPASTPDLLPGVDLVTEEIEPGVYRVLSDGVRELSVAPRSDLYLGGALDRNVVAGPGGSVWLFWPDESFRLGDADSRRWGRDPLPWTDDDVEIAPDGTALRVSGGLRYREPDGDWQSTGYPRSFLDIEVGPEGRLWGVWPNPYRCPKNGVGFKGGCASYVSRLDVRSGDDTIGRPSPGFKDHHYAGLVGFWATDGGSLWLWDRWAGRGENERNSVVKISGTEFDRIKLPVQMRRTRQWMTLADMNSDGVLWAKYGTDPLEPSLARFDGTEWRLFGKGDGVPLMGGHYQGHRGFLAVAPDGSVWVNPFGEHDETDGCEGLARFDGRGWSEFLDRQCIYALDIGRDGSVWVQATDAGAALWDNGRDDSDSRVRIDLYVITPEAVADTE